MKPLKTEYVNYRPVKVLLSACTCLACAWALTGCSTTKQVKRDLYLTMDQILLKTGEQSCYEIREYINIQRLKLKRELNEK